MKPHALNAYDEQARPPSQARLFVEVIAQAVEDLRSPNADVRKEAHLFFTAPSGGWAMSRRFYFDILGIDETRALRALGLDAPPKPTPRIRPRAKPNRDRPTIPRDVVLRFIGHRDYVTAGDLVEHFGMPIHLACARLNTFREGGYLERPSRGVYRIARTGKRPHTSARLLNALRDAPDGLTARELTWALDANPGTIYRALKHLANEGILIREPPRWRLAQPTP